MKVTGYNKYTGDIVYEVEVADCRPEHIADVSQCVRLGECWAYINDIPTRTEFKDENDTFFAAVNAGLAAAKLNGFRPFDVGDYVMYQGPGINQLGRVARFSNFDRKKSLCVLSQGMHDHMHGYCRPAPGNKGRRGSGRSRRARIRISSLRRSMPGL